MFKKSLIAFALFPTLAHGAEWKGEGELGYTTTSGNTDSTTLNTKLGVSKEQDKWKHAASIEALKTETDNVKSADSKVFNEKSEYRFAEKTYAFESIRYEDDKFSGFNYQASVAVGIGHQFLNSDKHKLDASAGLGYRKTEDAVTKETSDNGIMKGDFSYAYKISEYATFSEKALVESGEDNTHLESETALKMKINGNLSSKISYLVKNNSDVPAGTEKTDTVTTVSLVYGF